MKKLTIILAAVVLLASGVGGYAFAQTTHQPIVGQKLVGWGVFGNASGAVPGTIVNTIFAITNPDCLSEITINRISVFEDDGTLIYEGALKDAQGFPLSATLAPHQSIDTQLAFYLLPLPNDLREFPLGGAYTVEVSWTGGKGGLSLTGWTYLMTLTFDTTTGAIIENWATGSMAQMVNMTQVLTKSK